MPKSNPFSVRADIEKLGYLKKREKLQTNQSVLDFLLDAYWGIHHLKPQNPFSIEPTNSLEPISAPKPIQNIVTPTKQPETPNLGLFDALKTELGEAKTIREIENVLKAIKLEPNLSPKQKLSLEAYAKEVSKEMYTD